MGELLDIEKYDDWFGKNFEELITKYPHKAIAVVEEEIVAVGESEKEVDNIARKKYPDKIPFVVTIPSKEDLVCLLFQSDTKSTNR
jgi:hypothetical protein